jgi:hypothetical protein
MSDPFAPLPPSPAAPSLGSTPCAVCGTPVDPTAASYSESAQLICKRCEANETIAIGDERVVGSLVIGAASALATGAVSFCINPILLSSLAAIGGGIATIATLARHPEYRQKLGGRYPLVMAAAIVGALLGAGSVLLRILLEWMRVAAMR